MKSESYNKATICKIMADLHEGLNALSSSGKFVVYRGICPQLAGAMQSLGYNAHDYPHRKHRAHVLSNLMKGWIRRNPSMSSGRVRSGYLVMYPILPSGYKPAPCIVHAGGEPQEVLTTDQALHLFTSVQNYGEYTYGDWSRFGRTPPKPELYSEFIAARISLLSYLLMTTKAAHEKMAAQLAGKAVAHG